VPVIEVLVKVGDTIKAEDSLVTLESDKATMDVPSPVSGVVRELKLKVGDKVAEGSLVAVVDSGAAGAGTSGRTGACSGRRCGGSAPAPAARRSAAAAASTVEVRVPDIGDFKDVPIIELLVKVGDTVKAEDSLMTLESDKATMDIPSPGGRRGQRTQGQVGDKVAEGVLLALVKVSAGTQSAGAGAGGCGCAPRRGTRPPAAVLRTAPAACRRPPGRLPSRRRRSDHCAAARGDADAGRPPARQGRACQPLGAPLRPRTRRRRVEGAGTGPKGRILQGDVQAYVKGVLSAPPPAPAAAAATSGGGLDLLPWPKIDFSKFGPIEVQPLSRIKKISGANLSRNWVMIPAVTYHEDADITDLEAFRVQINKENEKSAPS
jgi:pyruvate dehydrogenase E2 component (dihydrolipoamide acetyltransferase)